VRAKSSLYVANARRPLHKPTSLQEAVNGVLRFRRNLGAPCGHFAFDFRWQLVCNPLSHFPTQVFALAFQVANLLAKLGDDIVCVTSTRRRARKQSLREVRLVLILSPARDFQACADDGCKFQLQLRVSAEGRAFVSLLRLFEAAIRQLERDAHAPLS
jgi:hypothetical protein